MTNETTRTTFCPFTTTGMTLDLRSTVDLMDALNFCRDGIEMIADLFVGKPDDVLNTQTAYNGVFRYLTGICGTLDAVSHRLSQMNKPATPATPTAPQTRNNNDLERASAIWELASKLKAHFDGLPHADQTGVLSQAYELVAMAEAALEDLSGDRK